MATVRYSFPGRTEIIGTEEGYEFREPAISYTPNFAIENGSLRPENRYSDNDSD